MNVLVLGANGYTGTRLLEQLIGRGHRVRILVRELEKGAALENVGVDVRVGDITDIESIRTVAQGMEIIFILVAYCRAEPSSTRAVLQVGTGNLLQVVDREALNKIIWTSNVSVYGQPRFDARLTEASPIKPKYTLGRLTAEVETRLRGHGRAVILRLPNVYGPGRDQIDALRNGRIRLLNGGDNWQSRIHIDDLVDILLAAMERAPLGATYLIGDDLPLTAKQFFAELADALHVPLPLPLETRAALAFGGASRALNWLAGQPQYQLSENVIGLLTGNYYCVNEKMKQELGITLKYPSFREAYQELLSHDS